MLWLRTQRLFTLSQSGSTVLVLVPGAFLASGVGPSLGLGPAYWAGLPLIAARRGRDPDLFRGFHPPGPWDSGAPYDPPA